MNTGKRLTPIGISAVINLSLMLLLVRTLTAQVVPSERYISVELERPPTVIQDQVIPKPPPEPTISPRPRPPVDTKPIEKPKPAPVPAPKPQAQVRHKAPLPVPQTVAPGSSNAAEKPGEIWSMVAGVISDLGGTRASGPGEYMGSGPAGGGTQSSPVVGTPSPGVQSATPTPAPVAEPPPQPRPSPPREELKPKGETRNARLTQQTEPAYPRDARDYGIEGTVVLAATIRSDGRVSDVRIEQSSGDRRLDRSAADAVRRWRYEPALKDGLPVKSSVRVKVHFRLE